MNPDTLREHLSRLHEELSGVQRVDPNSTQLLDTLMQDLKRLMAAPPAVPAWTSAVHRDASGEAATATVDRSLSERLEKIAVQFEAAHPTLAASSRRLVDLLGKVGV